MKIGLFSLKNSKGKIIMLSNIQGIIQQKEIFFSCIIPEDLTRISGGKLRREI